MGLKELLSILSEYPWSSGLLGIFILIVIALLVQAIVEVVSAYKRDK